MAVVVVGISLAMIKASCICHPSLAPPFAHWNVCFCKQPFITCGWTRAVLQQTLKTVTQTNWTTIEHNNRTLKTGTQTNRTTDEPSIGCRDRTWFWLCRSDIWLNSAQAHIHLMCERKTLSDNNIYFRATPHICIEMYKEEKEQDKTPIFKMQKGGVTRK